MTTGKNDKRAKTQMADRITECALVVGFDVDEADVYIIKDTEGRTGRVSYAHALKRLALAKLRSEVRFEQDEMELDEDENEGEGNQ